MTMDSIIDQLSTNQAFLEMISIKLGLKKPDEEDSENDDEEGGCSHQHGAGSAPKNLQQHHGDRRKARNDQIASEGEAGVPPLALDRMKANKGKGWKRLKKAFTTGLVGKATSTHIQGAKGKMVNTVNLASLVGMVDPVEGASYVIPEQVISVEVILIKDIMADTERLKQEQALLLGETVQDAEEHKEADKTAEEHRLEWQQKAIVHVKNSKIAELEEALDEDVPVDTTDDHGSTLLMLACQQGNKRIAKFLLRRGAKLNYQNLNGNTCLHYCYEYKLDELAEYMKSKGADDSLLNADGLTC